MKDEIGKVMCSRVETPEGAVTRMRKPGKGMPVTAMKCSYHPVESVDTYGMNVNVLKHVHTIIPHKTIFKCGNIDNEGERKKQEGNNPFTT